MARPSQDITDAELSVVQVLWDAPGATIRQITERLYPAGSTSHYATVQKLLERLEAKKIVRRDPAQVPHKFIAEVSRNQLISRRLRGMANQLCQGSLAPLLTQLVQSQPLKKSDLEALRTLIDQLDRQGKKPKR
jgi:BlaI family penicillinase repressor